MSQKDDARRYRFLRDNALAVEFKVNAPAVFMCDDKCKTHGPPIDGARLDRQIDLAIAAAEAMND